MSAADPNGTHSCCCRALTHERTGRARGTRPPSPPSRLRRCQGNGKTLSRDRLDAVHQERRRRESSTAPRPGRERRPQSSTWSGRATCPLPSAFCLASSRSRRRPVELDRRVELLVGELQLFCGVHHQELPVLAMIASMTGCTCGCSRCPGSGRCRRHDPPRSPRWRRTRGAAGCSPTCPAYFAARAISTRVSSFALMTPSIVPMSSTPIEEVCRGAASCPPPCRVAVALQEREGVRLIFAATLAASPSSRRKTHAERGGLVLA